MAKLTNFPHLSQSEFDEACTHLHTHFQQYSHLQDQWLSLDHRQSFDTKYLRITKGLLSRSHPATIEPEHELEIEEDGDEEALPPSTPLQSVLQYDILLSPTYSVPTLYISIKDPLHRYPPTMSTLYETVIPPEYSSQTKDFGVLGGITIAVRFPISLLYKYT
jgi:ubiquitin-like-conjugating enzyme ATG10